MTQTDSEKEKQASIKAQIAKFIKNGYKRNDLFVTPTGSVIYDPAAAEAEAFKDFEKKEDQSS
ncbi:hypothetical protein BH10CYA1_BH10CYA1_63480 [soil metagenome]